MSFFATYTLPLLVKDTKPVTKAITGAVTSILHHKPDVFLSEETLVH